MHLTNSVSAEVEVWLSV